MAYQLVAGSPTRAQFNFANPSLSVNAGSGADRILIGGMALRGSQDADINAITYNGAAVSVIGSTTFANSLRVFLFYLINPSEGSNTLAITPSATANRQFEVQVAVFVGADQDSPLDDWGVATGSSATPSVTLDPTTDDELLFGFCIHEGANANTTGDGETTIYNNDNGAWVTSSSYAVQTTAAQQSVDWTNAASDVWHAIAAGFKVAADANTSPTTALDTADEAELGSTPTLQFTITDSEGDDVRANVQVTTDSEFSFVDGDNLTDSYTGTHNGVIHPQPIGGTTWLGDPVIDDRPGQSFVGKGGVLDKIIININTSNDSPDGTAYVRLYAHEGTFGTSSAPLNAADAADTPTPGWLAISDAVELDSESPTADYEFAFSGANRIRLEEGVHYIFILDWVPTTIDLSNTFTIRSETGGANHPGNMYIDGGSANNGVQPWDMLFEVYETHLLLDKVSGTDAGFANEDNGSDTDPFTSGDQLSFTVQEGDALDDGVTYYWRARGVDPSGTNIYGDWATARSFTVSDSGGTTETVSIGGSATPSGSHSVAVQAAYLGSVTPTGQLLRDASIAVAGSVASTGQLLRQAATSFAGSVAPSSAVSIIKSLLLSVQGSVTSSGALLRQTQKRAAGSVSPAGSLQHRSFLLLSGAVAAASTVSNIKALLQTFTGAVTPSSSLASQVQARMGGAVLPVGAVVKQSYQTLASAVTPSSVVSSIRARLVSLAGAVTSSSGLALLAQKLAGGQSTPSGDLAQEARVTLSGSVIGESSLARRVFVTVAGAVSATSTVVASIVSGTASAVRSAFRGMFRGMFKE